MIPSAERLDVSMDGAEPRRAADSVRRGTLARTARQFRRDKLAVAALFWIALVGVVAVVGRFWTPHPPNRQLVGDLLQDPAPGTWLGTDDLGRDVLSRLMVGASVALWISGVVVGCAVVLAVPVGLFAGYRGGSTDTIIMRALDALTSIPGIVAALAIIGVLGPGLVNVAIALVVVLVPNLVRLVRAQALSVSAESFVLASKSVGSRPSWILAARVLPGVVPALAVQVSLSLGAALTAEAGLSFLGIGVVPPDASWGGDLSRAYRNLLTHPTGVVAPMLAVGSVVLACNLVGDGIRDALGTGAPRRSWRRSRMGLTTVAPDRERPAGPADHSATGDHVGLSVRDLRLELHVEDRRLTALDGVALTVRPGEMLGIVGESGSGKTLTALSAARLLASPPGLITGGSVRLDGIELLDLSMREMRAIRGGGIGMVFQNPMTSLDPVYTVGNSLREAIRNHEPMSKRAATRRAAELLALVGIPSPERRLRDYPHSLSGGMRQRVMIAMALAGRPRLLIADEPTTALDVTIQAQVLELIASLRDELQMSVIMVTHDLGVVADSCDTVAVMYAGQIVEAAPVESLFDHPAHPYTAGLLAAMPSMAAAVDRLDTLAGSVPPLDRMPSGCRFAPRCQYATNDCRDAVPPMRSVRGHDVRCIHPLDVGVHT